MSALSFFSFFLDRFEDGLVQSAALDLERSRLVKSEKRWPEES